MANSNSLTAIDLAARAAASVMDAAREAGSIDDAWLQRFEQLDETDPGACFSLAAEAPTPFLQGYVLAKAAAALNTRR
jgi:hypothetical protein